MWLRFGQDRFDLVHNVQRHNNILVHLSTATLKPPVQYFFGPCQATKAAIMHQDVDRGHLGLSSSNWHFDWDGIRGVWRLHQSLGLFATPECGLAGHDMLFPPWGVTRS